MIKVLVTKEKNNIKKIIMDGHANYADYGKDIVCAAASSIAITTINAILEINKNWIDYSVEKELTIEAKEDNEILNKLLNNMVNMLKELEKDYQKNIIIKEE